ncbi:MAG: hypothetical protein WBX15_18585 [Thermoanaerobaculia bacterium]
MRSTLTYAAILSSLLLLTLSAAATAADGEYRVQTIELPGASGGISIDYIAYDPATGSVWVPAGNTAAVDVIDSRTGKIRQITGLPTTEITWRDRKHVVGPSAASAGDGVVYVGNRGDSSVCGYDSKTLERRACETLPSMPDGVKYVSDVREVWVTTPRDRSLHILDAKTLHETGHVVLKGSPEGYAVDTGRHRFYTNLEDADRTVVLDTRTHQALATWSPKCGEEGPRGLAIDSAAGHLFVACTDHVEVLDTRNGNILSTLDTGAGVDNLDYAPHSHLLYAAAGRAGKLMIARDDAKGELTLVASVPTRTGARNGVVTDDGTVYVAHGGAGEMVVVSPPTVK